MNEKSEVTIITVIIEPQWVFAIEGPKLTEDSMNAEYPNGLPALLIEKGVRACVLTGGIA